ncbi:pepsin/retropepsin-like aspartic protease family protein [Lysobacter terrae]
MSVWLKCLAAVVTSMAVGGFSETGHAARSSISQGGGPGDELTPSLPEEPAALDISEAWRSADRGDFKPLEAIAVTRAHASRSLLAQARRAAASLDYPSVRRALARVGQLRDLPPRERAWADGVEANTAFAQGDYAHAAEAALRWQSELTELAVVDELSDANRLAGLSRLLADIPRQRVLARSPRTLQTTRDTVGLRRALARINGQEIFAVVDTGANLSVVSRSTAMRLKLRMIEGSGSVATGSRDSIPVSLGVAKEAKFAGITFANVVFIVLDDAQLAPIPGYRIDAIIGFPLLRDLGRVRFGRDETITPEPAVRAPSENASPLRLSGSDLFVDVTFNDILAPVLLDTGAAKSAMSPLFAERHRHLFSALDPKTVHKGGAGGVTEQKVVSWPNVRVSIGHHSALIPEIAVEIDESKDVSAKNFGVLGQDVLSAFDSYTLDFDHMQFEIGRPVSEGAGSTTSTR